MRADRVMTRERARDIAEAVVRGLTPDDVSRLKAVHVIARLHQGMLTVRLHFFPKIAEDDSPYIFAKHEIL